MLLIKRQVKIVILDVSKKSWYKDNPYNQQYKLVCKGVKNMERPNDPHVVKREVVKLGHTWATIKRAGTMPTTFEQCPCK